MYQVEARHTGLHKFRVIKGMDRYVVEQKARAQLATWDAMWEKRQAIEARTQARTQARLDLDSKRQEAAERTEAARQALYALETILEHTLGVDDAVAWETLKDRSPFVKPKPARPEMTPRPREPQRADDHYRVRLGFWDRALVSLFSDARKRRFEREMDERFEEAWARWKHACTEAQHADAVASKQHAAASSLWARERADFMRTQAEAHTAIDRRREEYAKAVPEAVVDMCDLVLSRSEYPPGLPQEYDMEMLPEVATLLIDYMLPAPDDLSYLKEVKYVQTRDEFTEVTLPDKARSRLYDQVLYQVALRTVHELFEADVVLALSRVVFNGWVTSVDPTTGQEIRPCVLSVQATRQDFKGLELAHVDPKACFRKLKGVGSSQLHSLASVPPIQRISREDPRFVPSHGIVADLDQGANLASMDWEEFEHLVREVFEKEFSRGGGEVKVTRASRDGGVDAVAFDPDPIRGGKIVIQAKRYTRTVGVSAVRDLYGTVMNEGASKGILVTTADYGPDAYKFAEGKPLTLLSGSNLLHLMEKHGHRMRIDLAEARRSSAPTDADDDTGSK